MAQQHTTPERSLAAAYAQEERAAGVGKESRLKKDPCYQLYEESLRCLDENDYDRGMCEDAFNTFKACRARQRNVKAGVEEGASNLDRMLKAQENDLVLGTLMKGYRMVRDAASSTFSSPQEQPLEPGPEPEWKVAKRQREEERQQQQQMQEMQDVLQRQQEEQQVQAQEQAQQQRGWRRWFGFKRSPPM